ncbi:MAG: NAD-dependent epimerase/dehydratase family protein [Bacteroidota bacterium]|nr:NAD-dependent epimerase/dehydratase family protein [Bacteroidota bacterium]
MEGFKNKTILITGGAGFVGSNLAKRISTLQATGIYIVDNLLSSEVSNIANISGVEFIKGSIADDAILEKVMTLGIDYIFHLSTYHGNQSSIHNPLADHENNLLTTLKLFDKFKNNQQIERIVYSAAGCAVAEKTTTDATATNEDAGISLDMDSPYSISKIVGEFYSVYYHKQHQLPTVRARFQNVYGPGEILGAGEWRGTPATVWRNVTPTFIYKAIKGMPLQLENAGSGTRDFIFVEDIVEGLMACALKGRPGDVYNLANGHEVSIKELAELIIQLTNSSSTLEVLPKRWWDHSIKRFGSTEKSKNELGFAATTQIKEGLQKTISWTVEHLEEIDRTILKHSDRIII